MLEKHIKKLIKNGEKTDVELKLAQGGIPNSIFETICAFSNRFGGHIILGVEDGTKKIIGLSEIEIDKIKKDFTSLCNNCNKINPTVYLDVRDVILDGKKILYIYVPDSPEVHRSAGKIYDRNYEGDFDITDNTHLVTNLYIRKKNIHFEDQIIPNSTIETTLRDDLINRARKMAVIKNNNHPWKDMDNFELLKSAKLFLEDPVTKEKGVTFGAVLLFGTDESIGWYLPAFRTDALLRKVNVSRYDDRDDIRTNLLDSFDRLMAFAQKHTNDPFYLDGTMRVSLRDKIVRELVSNLLIHRNIASNAVGRFIITKDSYYTENASIPIKKGLITVENLVPHSKNPHIAQVFKEIGHADELGSGVRNITESTKKYTNQAPVFEEGDYFRITVPMLEYIPENTQEGHKKGTR